MAAGAADANAQIFAFDALAGKLIKMWLAAYAGAGAFIWLGQLFR